MNTNRILVGIVLLGLLLTLAIGPGLAQGPGPEDSASSQAALGTAFTYQGRLTDASGPVTGNCDFRFSLWNAAGSGAPPSGGAQIGENQAKTNVAVSSGLFTIPDLNFGGAAFNGDARWLQIAVRCPTGSGTYVTLAPRQALTPAPYALALPGLWTQQSAESPNLIGGYSGNSVTDGVYGATIGGGGTATSPNQVTDPGGTVSGGYGNRAGSEPGSLLASFNATVGGGDRNTASGGSAAISGGSQNTASGPFSAVGGGSGNTAGYQWATVGGGQDNTASASGTSIGGGRDNKATDIYATVPGGREAWASHYGEMAYASGRFASDGDAQTSVYVLRNETSDAVTETELFLNGEDGSERLTIAFGRTVTFDILLVARSSIGESIGCTFQGVIKNVGGTTAFVMTPGKLCQKGGLAWDANVVADNGNDALQIEVTGAASTNIRWVARVQTAEVSY